jgi:hypothetical protein
VDSVLDPTDPDVRQLVIAVVYLLCGQRDLAPGHRALQARC